MITETCFLRCTKSQTRAFQMLNKIPIHSQTHILTKTETIGHPNGAQNQAETKAKCLAS